MPQRNKVNWLHHLPEVLHRKLLITGQNWTIKTAQCRGCNASHLLSVKGAMHTGMPFFRVRWARVDKWQRQFARWMIMESSRNFSCDTCLSKFTQGWVRDHQSPSGIKNYQREDTNQNPKSWLTPLQSSIYGSLIIEIHGLEYCIL